MIHNAYHSGDAVTMEIIGLFARAVQESAAAVVRYAGGPLYSTNDGEFEDSLFTISMVFDHGDIDAADEQLA